MVPRLETVLVGGGIFYLLSHRTFTPDLDIVIYGSPNSIFMQLLLLVSVASALIIAAYLIDFGLKWFPYYESSRDWRSHAGVTQGIVEGIIGLLTAIVMMSKWLEYASFHRCLCPHQVNCERLENTWTIGFLRKISSWSRCSDWQHVVTFMPQTTLTLVVFVVALLLRFFGGSSGGEEVAIGAAGDPTPPDDPVPSDPKRSTDPNGSSPSDPKTSTDPNGPSSSDPKTSTGPNGSSPSDPKTSTDPNGPSPSDPKTSTGPNGPSSSDPKTSTNPNGPSSSDPKTSTDPNGPSSSDPKTSTDPSPPPPPLCPICNHLHPHNSDNDSDTSSKGSGSKGKKPKPSSSKGKKGKKSKKKACNNCGTCHSTNEEISGRSITESPSSRRRRSIIALLAPTNDRNAEANGTQEQSIEHLFVQPPPPNAVVTPALDVRNRRSTRPVSSTPSLIQAASTSSGEGIETRRRSARIRESRSRKEGSNHESL